MSGLGSVSHRLTSSVAQCRSSMDRYSGLPPLPARLSRLGELAVDLWWSWHRDARSVFRRLDYTLWRATAHNPVRMLWMIARERLDGGGGGPRLPRALRPGHRGARRRAGRAQHLVGEYLPADLGAFHRVLLGRIRPASVAADLRGRSRRAGGRSLQGSQRPRRAADRRRVHVSARLLPSECVGRRLAAGKL